MPTFKHSALLLLILILSASSGNSQQKENEESVLPNILLILSDDQAWTDYGFMGHEVIQTPHLDQLACESVLFDRGYVVTALCRPSLMSIVTGQYASVHGITGNDPSRSTYREGSKLYEEKRAELISRIDAFDTIPKLLGKVGYVSHQSGKWWEGSYKRGGFTHGMTRGFPEPGGRHGDDGLKIGREGLKPCTDFVDWAVEQKKPFFMWYAPFLPHTPHNPPQRLLDKYKEGHPLPVAKYYAMCEWFDETCGELIGYFEKKGIRNNTLIIYICDNGWIQHPEKANRYDLRSKQTAYEGGIRQPIMFSWPDKLEPSKRQDLITNLDILPTMISAAGAPQPSMEVPGLDLLPYLKSGEEVPRKAIFGESFAHDIAETQDPRKSLLYRWCIEGQWKLLLTYDGEVASYNSTHPREEKRPQLFDLMKDPHEKTNLAKDHPEVVAKMVRMIDEWYPVERANTVKTFR